MIPPCLGRKIVGNLGPKNDRSKLNGVLLFGIPIKWPQINSIPSMFGIFTYIWLMFMVNVGKYTSPMDPMGMGNWRYFTLLKGDRIELHL